MPTEKTIRARDLGRLLRHELKADTEACRLVAYELAVEGEARAVRKTDEAELVDLGEYKRSWEHSRHQDGAAFGNTAPHAPVIERGRRPGRPGPPYEPILEWVKRKLFDAYDPVEDEVEAEGIAWAIRNKIHADGQAPRFVLLLVTTDLRARVKPAMVRVLQRRHGRE